MGAFLQVFCRPIVSSHTVRNNQVYKKVGILPSVVQRLSIS